MSPRSGTPVKLLGREDASVDWYNLEKSKRVKPFRCGEFDACIERAEASQGVPIKKREKYARREDAILHALELEKQYLEKQWQKHGANSNTLSHKLSGNSKKMMNSSSLSGVHLRDNENLDHAELVSSELQSRSRRVDFPFEEPSKSMPLHFQKGNHGKQMNWNDDNSPLLPHTGGLKDFDLHVAPLKGKEPSSALCENSQLASSDDDVDEIPNLHGIKELNDTGGVKNPIGVKRKISYATLMEESLVKRRDRRRPLTQVIQNSIKLPAKSLQGNGEWESGLGKELKEQSGAAHHAERSGCISLPANSSDCFNHSGHSPDQMQLSPTESGYSNGNQPGSLLGGDGSSGLIGDGETSSSEGDYLVADLDEEAGLHQGNSEEHASECVSAPGGGQEKLGKTSDNYDMSLSDYKVPAVSNDQTGGCAGIRVSKWHTKGKRNVRNLTRKSMEAFDGKDSAVSSDKCSGSLDGSVEKKPCIFKTGWERLSGQGLYHKDEELNYVYDDGEFFEKDNRVIGFGKHNYPLMLKAASRNHVVHGINDSDEDSHKMFASVWEANEPPHFVQRPYWEESDGFLDAHHVRPVDVDMAPRLVDVNLKVKASYQGEHVPLVSLMSRLNGKAIIGHPVHIEILEDGSSDLLCPRNHLGVSTTAVGELAAPTAWRTGKRTAMQRVPRSHLALSAQGEESEFIPYSDGEGRPPFKKPYVATKHCPHLKKSSKRKSHKKLSKKRSLPSQRTRALSSIAMEKKSNRVNASSKHRRRESGLDGLIKPGSTVPLITCVPVKVVFTRILEAIGRPPSASTTDPSLLASSIKRTSS